MVKRRRRQKRRTDSMTKDEMITVKEVHLDTDANRGNMVILKEEADANHYFVMFIGDAEFAAIAKERGFVEPKRPLTHDLYLNIIEKVPMEFLRIEINDMRDETYYARILFQAGGEEFSIDSRPSDAVALALNQNIPIRVAKRLMRRKLTPDEVKEYEDIVKTVKF
jgi:bifunctional DNase/RNase